MSELGAQAILAARTRIAGHVHRTPVLTSSTLDARLGAAVFFKAENLQRMGAFKIRGASNAIAALDPAERGRGVITHSSGNHAQAVALAARGLGIAATVVMPRTAAAPKVAAVRDYGAEVVFCEPTLAAREATTAELIERTGAVLVHPFEDERVIAGQGTAAAELFEDVPGLDLLVAPVGGGGLLAGTALAAEAFSPGTRVVAAEPAGADDTARSLAAGHVVPVAAPRSIADGLLATLGARPFAIIRRLMTEVAVVEEGEIVEAMRFFFERMKLVAEPSGAVSLAALLAGRLDVRGRRVGVILSGGNVDLARLPFPAA